MLLEEFRKIFGQVQTSTSSHQKHVKNLSNMYESVPFEDFFSEFIKCICILLQQKIGETNLQVQKCFKFCASFCTYLINQDAKRNESVDTDASHPFLIRLIQELLKYHDLDYVQVRFHVCQFIAILLVNINEDVTLNNDLCDDIQNAMLERINEIKPNVRIQAVMALGRLQDLSNNDCPVIKAYIAALGDPNAMVRKEVVDKIAPCSSTFSKIIERIYDIDYTVRTCAFTKLTLMGPKVFKIIDRRHIAYVGINEENKTARNSFVKMLLKWLSVYENDYIKLLNALKLDADEEDFKHTVFIYEKILDIFCVKKPVQEMIGALQLDDNKLIVSNKLNIEIVIYWHHLLNYFGANETTQEFYEMISPAPLALFHYIAEYIKEKTRNKLDDWEYLEFQHVLCKLLQITGQIDLSDEIRRQTLHTLVIKTMTEIKLDDLVLTELINIHKKIIPDLEPLSNEILSVIAEIREPLVEEAPDSYLVRERDFKIAQINLKQHILQDEMQEAVSKNEFLTAAAKEQELAELKEKIKDLQENFIVNPKVRKVQTDLETTCRCLDIVIALLQNTEMQTFPESIVQYKEKLIESYDPMTDTELSYRILKFFAMYALSDKQFACDKIKIFCFPVLTYCLVPHYNKTILLLSINTISDLLRVYGPSIFNSDGSVEADFNHRGRRRLHNNTQLDVSNAIDLDSITSGMVIGVILDVMDDEVQEVREGAAVAACRLVERGLVVSPSLITRLLLKLFNPLTEKQDQKIQQMLSFSIIQYAQMIKGSADVLENAVLPTLCSIGNAPKTSPLADININSILQFLAALTRLERNEFSNTHKQLAYSIFEKILKNPEDKCICILSMMLRYLHEPAGDQFAISELNKFIEKALNVITDKHVIKYLSKYSQKLAGNSISTCRTTENTLTTRNHSAVSTHIIEKQVEQVAVDSINSCRATIGSVNSNAEAEDFIRSGLSTSVSESFAKKRQRKQNNSDTDKSSVTDSDSENAATKKRWLKRKRTNILQLSRKETLRAKQKECINVDQTKHTTTADRKSMTENVKNNKLINTSPNKNAENIKRSNGIIKDICLANGINQSVIIYVPRIRDLVMLRKLGTIQSTAEANPNLRRSNRLAEKGMERTLLDDLENVQSRNLNNRRSSKLTEKSIEKSPFNDYEQAPLNNLEKVSSNGQSRNSSILESNLNNRRSSRLTEESIEKSPFNDQELAPLNDLEKVSINGRSLNTSIIKSNLNRRSSRLAEKGNEKSPFNGQEQAHLNDLEKVSLNGRSRNSSILETSLNIRRSSRWTEKNIEKPCNGLEHTPLSALFRNSSIVGDSPNIQKSNSLTKKHTKKSPVNCQLRNSIGISKSMPNISRTSTSSTPESALDTGKYHKMKNVRLSLRKLSRQKNENQLNLTNNVNNITQKIISNNLQPKRTLHGHSAVLNSTRSFQMSSKRTRKPETSDSDCSGPNLRKPVKKKQKISKKRIVYKTNSI